MGGSVRVGNTVRRATGPNTELVFRVLGHLEDAGVALAPRALGVDDEGREILSWIPGVTTTAGRRSTCLRSPGWCGVSTI